MSPPDLHDPVFGTLTHDPDLEAYVGHASWCGARVKVTLETSDEALSAAAMEAARRLWTDASGWNAKVRGFAAEALVPLKNGRWLQSGEAPLTAAAFDARLRLRSIAFDLEGGWSFWFDDGDLFWGHLVRVDGTVGDGPTGAGIAG